MKRRNFISKNLAMGALIPASCASFGFTDQKAKKTEASPAACDDVVVEKLSEEQPHKGKVLAVIQPHCDDIPFFAAGTVAKLIYEGYTGYLIRTSNDEAAGSGASTGERVLNNEKDNDAVAKVLGLKRSYDLGYANHRMDEYNIQEIKGRLIFLFRLLQVDTLVCFDPWGTYEENPDHYITARAVEAARWMAGMSTDYPEQLEVVKPHTVTAMYYFARGPQIVNRVVDISKFVDKKVESLIACKTQGAGGDNGVLLKKMLADKGQKLSVLGDDDDTANFNYVKEFVLDIDSDHLRGVPSDRKSGAKYGLEWAERFHYIGPSPSKTDKFIQENAVSI
ncbi:MAG: PIG-L family deacetylase [Bacteroidales bacterium]|nr:PIG-L family deacetylase [Bacteroidales bacterium]